jgi:hypothetical protein
MWKALITEKFKEGRTLGDKNAERWYLKYRSTVCNLALLGALVCIFFGWWLQALFCYLFWHFHILITDNYWKIKTIEHYLETRDAKKDEPK